jgi:hypothetical protein
MVSSDIEAMPDAADNLYISRWRENEQDLATAKRWGYRIGFPSAFLHMASVEMTDLDNGGQVVVSLMYCIFLTLFCGFIYAIPVGVVFSFILPLRRAIARRRS